MVLESNQRYLFCFHGNDGGFYYEADGNINYKSTINHYLQPISPFRTYDYWTNEFNWYKDGYGSDVIPAITLHISGEVGVNETKKQFEIIPFPNPTTNLLTIPLRKGVLGNVKVEVFDLAGKLVLSENQTIANEPLKVNVASIKNGAYLFNLTFADGSKDVFKISVNR